jgi:hypothetical protein
MQQLIRTCVVVAAVMFMGWSPAARAADTGGDPVDTLPPAATTYVGVSATLLDLERMPDAADGDPNFDATFWVRMRWSDPRLAFDGPRERHYLERDAQAMLARIWEPAVRIDQQADDRERLSLELIVAPDGQVTYEEQFRSRVGTTLNLRRFPFDTQHLELAVLPELSETDVILKAADAKPPTITRGHPSEWT